MRSPLALALGLALLPLLAACRQKPGSGEPIPDPGPFQPPAAAAAAAPGTVDNHENRGARATYAEELLRGRIPGVQVIPRPTGGYSIRVRGTTSGGLSSEPLYVVDGFPMDSEREGGIFFLTPMDIEKIEVLKDPASTSFYGSRGANGVVVITTKHGP
jgi:TonB-dependent SusC/RagA subfamily outer membrane receptor